MMKLSGLNPFWSNEIIDENLSDLSVSVNKPRREEDVLVLTALGRVTAPISAQ